MANRHKVQALKTGGKARPFYAGAASNVAKEAESTENKKRGGRAKKDGGKVIGRASGGRLDKRARGGGIQKFATGGGADKHPFSSAHLKGGRGQG